MNSTIISSSGFAYRDPDAIEWCSSNTRGRYWECHLQQCVPWVSCS